MNSINSDGGFWGEKTVCVTGGNGFLGSYVVEKLKMRGAKHIFIARHADFDLVKSEDVQRMLSESKPDLIIHLAANVGGIGANRERPAEFFFDNLMMGSHLIHESWKFGVGKFVAIGTVCSYPKFTTVPFKEEDFWDGYPEETNAPYGLAKKMMLVQSQAYRMQYGFNSIYLIPVNLYGPGDDFDLETSHVVPALIRKCIEAKEQGITELEVWGDGSPTREFLYVEDAAEGILLGAEQYNSAEPVNLGSGEEISIRNLAELIEKMTSFDGKLVWNASKPNGQPRRGLDTQKAKQYFGFEAQIPFEVGLQNTVDWYRGSREASGNKDDVH